MDDQYSMGPSSYVGSVQCTSDVDLVWSSSLTEVKKIPRTLGKAGALLCF